jgi:hypothetical protein
LHQLSLPLCHIGAGSAERGRKWEIVFRHPKTAITTLVLIVSLAGILRANPPVGDLDGNFMVNIQDMGGFADQWLDDPNGSANLNGDDRINIGDFALLAENWQKGTPLIISEFMANKNSRLNVQVELVRQPGEFVVESAAYILKKLILGQYSVIWQFIC